MKHVSTLTSATLKQTAAHGGCGECQTSCQSLARLLAPWQTRSASTLSNRRFQMSMGAPWARLAMYIGGNNKK